MDTALVAFVLSKSYLIVQWLIDKQDTPPSVSANIELFNGTLLSG